LHFAFQRDPGGFGARIVRFATRRVWNPTLARRDPDKSDAIRAKRPQIVLARRLL